MTEVEIAQQVLRKITGGGKVCSEVEQATVELFALDAFREVKPWYDEPEVFKTLQVTITASPDSSARSGYIDMTLQTPPVKRVTKVVPIELESDYTGDIVRDLLLLPAAPLDTRSIMEQAHWELTWPMIKSLLGRDLRYRYEQDNKFLYMDDILRDYITVFYVPDPQDVNSMTRQKVIQWVVEMTEALTKEAIANVRGKFRGGAIRFETDASEMGSDARERQRELREKLERLWFVPFPK